MKFIELTDWDTGRKSLFNIDRISAVTVDDEGEVVVHVDGVGFYVKESYTNIRMYLNIQSVP